MLQRINLIDPSLAVDSTTEEEEYVVGVTIIDTDEKQSILTTKSVSYRNGKVVMDAYLDNFPFPYYVILDQAKALPQVLSDALRQWFEMLTVKQ